ncbi:MAG TPA: RNA pseudouridine synthase, partial [Candidatus Nitrosotenuis sp.]|nr:RNA pseudouridine synthase [Candidatus Nitrosotenuis sp.]
IVYGKPDRTEGIIDLPLAPQSSRKNLWWMKVDHDTGKPALTAYRILQSNGTHTWLELKPKTGRTHQLRVHCAAMGWPIIGDKIYGQNEDKSSLCLHAASIEIPLYPKRPPIIISAPAPGHMTSLISLIQNNALLGDIS